jgi:hypothetical protein
LPTQPFGAADVQSLGQARARKVLTTKASRYGCRQGKGKGPAKKNEDARHRTELGQHASLLKRHNTQLLKQIKSQIASIEAEVRLKAIPLPRRFAILTSIRYLAAYSPAPLIEMPEVGIRRSDRRPSLAGLAPVGCQSGRWTGRSFLRGRRANARVASHPGETVVS